VRSGPSNPLLLLLLLCLQLVEICSKILLLVCCRLKAERSAARIDRAAEVEAERVEEFRRARKKADERRGERGDRQLGLQYAFAETLRHNGPILKVRKGRDMMRTERVHTHAHTPAVSSRQRYQRAMVLFR
jgi:hypothetical protein